VTVDAWGHGPVPIVHGPSVALDDDADGTTRWVALGQTGTGEVGAWEIDLGTAHDIEVDEVFVVPSGRATVAVEGSPEVAMGPGDIVRLRAGTATTWVVTERLGKVHLSW
jgi:uncharacterized cupin superfamily protein